MRKLLLLSLLLLAACKQYSAKDVEFIDAYQKASGGKFKIGKAYEVKGKTYEPTYDPSYEVTGVASWYGPGFHGKKTANGEKFNKNLLTAAHPTLPLPSIVEVTNLDNGKTVVVKINDRGPFANDRIIDLSKEAADQIGMLKSGTANVKVKLLGDQTLDYLTAENIMN